MDRETFNVFWTMSESGAPTEHLFMRIHQTEHYLYAPKEEYCLDVMPNVRPFDL